jgi:hypothetical protein
VTPAVTIDFDDAPLLLEPPAGTSQAGPLSSLRPLEGAGA